MPILQFSRRIPRVDPAAQKPVLQRIALSTANRRVGTEQKAADNHIYFSVRSVSANGLQHILQFAFVDGRGNVVLSAFGSAPSPVREGPHGPSEPVPIAPLDACTLDYLLSRVCNGANLVTFGRV